MLIPSQRGCLSPFGLLAPNSTAWVTYQQQNFVFLTVLEAEGLGSRCQQGWLPVRPYSRLQTADFPLSAHGGRG